MKIKNLLSSFVVLFSITLLISCENEPLDPVLASQISTNTSSGGSGGTGGTGGTGGVTPASVIGTYNMTAFNTSILTDLNNDGVASPNQMSETTCFNGNTLILNSNNTFVQTTKGVEINGSAISCYVDPDINGIWSVSGSVLTISYVYGGVPVSDNYVISGNTLTYSVTNEDIVGTTSGGSPVTLNGDISIVYTKQ